MAEQQSGQGDLFEPRMPEVDTPPNIENVFAEARKAALGEGASERDPRGGHARPHADVTALPAPRFHAQGRGQSD